MNTDYDELQLQMLRKCSNSGNMAVWNEWRKKNPDISIVLKKATLNHFNLQGAKLRGANLQGAKLWGVNLQGAKLRGAKLQRAQLWKANLQEVDLMGANLQGAELMGANLQGADLIDANLQSTKLKLSHVDGTTMISDCKFDKNTDFTGVGLDSATIDPELKTAFKDNIRRKKWQEWLSGGSWLQKWIKTISVRPFWWATGYGSSTTRIVGVFIVLWLLFGAIYFALEMLDQGVIENLRLSDSSYWHVLWRAVYFSVVTMTTLGFGDMYATKNTCILGFWGAFLLSTQVILGYVMLGALVTRLGVMFTNEAPAAKPTPWEEEHSE